MGKQAKPKTDRASTVKAGLGKNFVAPPEPVHERQVGRELGFSQFVSKSVLTAPETRISMKNGEIKEVTKFISVRYAWDANRKQVLTNPHFKES